MLDPIQFPDTENKHKCYAEREGEYVIFRCIVCHDYERTLHLPTGKFTLKCDPDNLNRHYGSFVTPGLDVKNGYTPN